MTRATDGSAPDGAPPNDRIAADSNPEPVPGPPKWLLPLRDRVVNRPGGTLLWQIAVAVLGGLIVIVGVVLLPLPGPGWAIIFVGLAVWATEFSWAQRLLLFARRTLTRWTQWVLSRPWPLRILIGLAGLAFLAGVFYLVYLVLYA